MTPIEFKVACARLDMTYKEMAAALRVSGATTSRWANNKVAIPYTAEFTIQVMLERGALKHAAGESAHAD